MFTDIAALSLHPSTRHRELLAEAEQYRLGRLARAARRGAGPATARRAPATPRPPGVPPERTESPADRRTLVPR